MKRIDALKLLMGDDDSGKLTIEICGTFYQAERWIQIYEYLNADILVPKEDLQEPKDEAENNSRKQQQKTAAENDSKPVADDTKPTANNNKPVKKVTAGSGKRGRESMVDTGKLIALAKAGWSREKIADELKVSVATVYGHLKKAREEGKL